MLNTWPAALGLINGQREAFGTVLNVRHRQFAAATDDQMHRSNRMAPTGQLFSALAPNEAGPQDCHGPIVFGRVFLN